MENNNNLAQIIEIVGILSALADETSENAGTNRNVLAQSVRFGLPNNGESANLSQLSGDSLLAQASLHTLLAAYQDSTFDSSIRPPPLPSSRGATFPANSTAQAQNLVAHGDQSQHHTRNDTSAFSNSALGSPLHDLHQQHPYHSLYGASTLIQRFLDSRLARFGMPPITTPLQAPTPSATATERPILELLHRLYPSASLDTQTGSFSAPIASPYVSSHALATERTQELQQVPMLHQHEQGHPQNQSLSELTPPRTPIHAALSSTTTNNGSAAEAGVTSRSASGNLSGKIKEKATSLTNSGPIPPETMEVASHPNNCFDISEQVEMFRGGNAIILPCKARGMPKDHDFTSAHFVIPPGQRHGEDLVCSHHQCRNSGVKFSYCAICRLPVAKRNFHQRHSHGLPCLDSHASANADVSPLDNVSAGDEKETAIETDNKDVSGKGTAEVPSDSLHGSSSATSQRKRKWSDLLEKRPATSDTSSMSAWLQELIQVSEVNPHSQDPNGEGIPPFRHIELSFFLERNNEEQGDISDAMNDNTTEQQSGYFEEGKEQSNSSHGQEAKSIEEQQTSTPREK